MLWINGYISSLGNRLGLNKPAGRAYWAEHLYHAGNVLKDWNWLFVDPASSLTSSPADRFQKGYEFGMQNFRALKHHIMLSGNSLYMVAHGHGVAFAEGLAAYLHEEKGITTDILINLQGYKLSSTPQCREAVSCRIFLKTKKDWLANKFDQSPSYSHVMIIEESLKTDFSKYSFFLPCDYHKASSNTLYLKGAIGLKNMHRLNCVRQFKVWTAIDHALKLFMESQEVTLTPAYDTRQLRGFHYHKHFQN